MNTLDTHILTRLNAELAHALTIGRTPCAIYLGQSEHAALEEAASQFVPDLKGAHGGILTWNGLAVFPVSTFYHVGFGFRPDSPCS